MGSVFYLTVAWYLGSRFFRDAVSGVRGIQLL